ncbi:hypothetical protein HMPREF9004_0209 [Schaalia cardiffensis F0333]|uniref:Uncharacterized protein n=1 Tax=Schaalia cardiffensis F0333 TaxID=888050 RepID=N6W921_9ACTO|nr:hypothetical protein HMPREF9004_0209 [Schaalia cardiffensis F0333]
MVCEEAPVLLLALVLLLAHRKAQLKVTCDSGAVHVPPRAHRKAQ